MKRLAKVLLKPKIIILYLLNLRIFNLLSDKRFLKIKYRIAIGKKLNLNLPSTFNEKLQWLKLFDRKDIYTTMVDKYEAKKYVANILGKEYIIKTIGVYKKFSEIDFTRLPKEFVIKCTHNSGGVIVVKDKSDINIQKIKKTINKLLKYNYFYSDREWPYKNVQPRIIIEERIETIEKEDLKDYKLFCFNGKVKIILVCSDRKGNYKTTNFYDINWNLLPFTRETHNNSLKEIKRPHNLEKMIKIAEKLAKGIPFIRVDLYEVNNEVFFGELTFYPSSGFEGFNPDIWDKKLGDMLELPNNKEEEKNEK